MPLPIAPGLPPDLLLRQIYMHLSDYAVFSADTQGLVTSWNLGASLIFGYAAEEMLGRSAEDLFTIADQVDGEPQSEMQQARASGRAGDFRWHQRKDGSLFWADGVMTLIAGDDGEPLGYLKILRDITERKLAEDQILRLATLDVLTSLANRADFDTRRSEMVALAERTGQLLLLLMIDLDHFKEVNDVLGHQAGDQMLQMVAQRIRRVSRESDYVARLGGDEFALLQLHPPSPASGGTLAEKLLQELAQPFTIDGHETKISASIGIAVCPGDAVNPDELLKKADLALYHAKHSGRNCYHYYTHALDEIAHRKNADHNELKRLMHDGGCGIVYQPILDASGRTAAMEALLRLPGYLGRQPVEYALGLAGEIGLLPELGIWVTRKACAELRRWRDAGVADVRICINTCAKELRDQGFLWQLYLALRDNDLAAADVEIELTERDAIELESTGSKVIEQLRVRGFTLSLDDFGTGYSSLSYLRTLPVSTLKLDKSFLKEVPEHADANAIVNTVIRLAHDLRLMVVAEGVESAAQADFLRAAGCNAFQGFLYSRPLAADDALAWLLEGSH